MKKLLPLVPLMLLCAISHAQSNITLQATLTNQSTRPDPPNGRKLFLKNCAHCHGADARGDDGPDLYRLDDSDEWITNRIRNGKKGQMTAFAGKLKPVEIASLLAYLRTLK